MNTLLVVLVAFIVCISNSSGMGDLKKVTEQSDPTLWFRARDVVLMTKEQVLSRINANNFALGGDNTIYSFDLVQLAVQAERNYIFYIKVQVEGYNFAHLRVSQEAAGMAWQWPLPELMAVQYVKSINDTIGYFENDEWFHI
eukprot:15331_1